MFCICTFLYFVYFFCKCFLPLSSFVMSSLVLSKPCSPKGVRINKANINIRSFKGVKRNSARHQAQVTDMKTMEIVLIMKMMTRTTSMTISRTMTMTSNNLSSQVVSQSRVLAVAVPTLSALRVSALPRINLTFDET